MLKNTNEGLEKQNILIKEVIYPFFKINCFSRKGQKFYRKLDYFFIKAEIVKHKYHNDDIENIRINFDIYSVNSYKIHSATVNFGSFSIPYWAYIETDENTGINELKKWLIEELDKLLKQFDEYNDLEKIIKKFENNFYINNRRDWSKWLAYAFLLKDNNRIAELNKWYKELKRRIKKLNEENIALSKNIKLIEKAYKGNNIKNNREYQNFWEKRRTCLIGIEVFENLLKKIGQ